MYIEFSLPTGSSGQAALYVNRAITIALHDWSDRYDIPYTVKNVKYFKRIAFDDDKHYTLFSMTWNPANEPFLSRWRIVSDLNNKTKFDSLL